MEVYRNKHGELACTAWESASTVSDLVNAVLHFCHNAVNCSLCAQTCCAGLLVYTDHVFLAKLSRLADQAISPHDVAELPARIMSFDKAAKSWFLTQNSDGRCKFLSRNNKCMIYAARPLVCRLHVCGAIAPDFRHLKEKIYFAYRSALYLEMIQKFQSNGSFCTHAEYVSNPVLGLVTYDTPLDSILTWFSAIEDASRTKLSLFHGPLA